MGKGLILTESNKEFLLKMVVDLSVMEDEGLEGSRNLNQLINCLSCVRRVQKIVTEIDECDFRAESQVVQDRISTFSDGLIFGHLDNLELLCPHKTIGNFLTLLLIKITICQIDLLNCLEIR